ncbi:MAG: dihydrofolate reductase [Candidatus Kapaibacterium sp.]|nr:MAG: dihydrofolate reductase [Candidatus Kapabacteria bacterium]
MIVSLVVAYDDCRGIGRGGSLPWHISADLALFKRITWGHHIVMGRQTFESIGRALPGRVTIVVTRSLENVPPGCHRAASLEDALAIAGQAGEQECFVIGGGQLYRAALCHADRIYASEIQGEFNCDTFFPPIQPEEWDERFATTITDERSGMRFRFRVLERRGRALPMPDILSEWANQG